MEPAPRSRTWDLPLTRRVLCRLSYTGKWRAGGVLLNAERNIDAQANTIAWCRLRGDIRWFDLSRIRGATATRRPCTGHDVSEIGTPPEQARPVGV